MSNKKRGVLTRPWLWFSSQLAHDLAPYSLPLLGKVLSVSNPEYRPFQWRGLEFRNPLGLAGGVDKTGHALSAWQKLGAGFLEVGTVTPEPQGPNPGKIMDRDLENEALWNKMGFPNPGMQALSKKLQDFKDREIPLFINIGKNRWTDNQQAHQDYSQCFSHLHRYADVFVANLSSPNTKGLRDLLTQEHLKAFLTKLKEKALEVAPDKPLLLKLSPDMDEDTLRMALSESGEIVDGWILTNTTKSRYPGSPFPSDQGGVSGQPLKNLSRQALKVAAQYKKQDPQKLLISVGGIGSPAEVALRMEMGADLVQFYSALVIQGPRFFAQTLSRLQNDFS